MRDENTCTRSPQRAVATVVLLFTSLALVALPLAWRAGHRTGATARRGCSAAGVASAGDRAMLMHSGARPSPLPPAAAAAAAGALARAPPSRPRQRRRRRRAQLQNYMSTPKKSRTNGNTTSAGRGGPGLNMSSLADHVVLDEPVGLSGYLMRLVPLVGSIIVTFFGTKISTMMRIFSVFWASAAPGIMTAIKPYVQDPNTEITVSACLGVFGGLYAGALASFASLKKRTFGMRVQGMAVGYIVSSMAQGLFVGFLLANVPAAAAYLDWINLAFTTGLGAAIGQLSVKYEDIVSIAATAVVGSYSQLQILVSTGITSLRGLSAAAMVGGAFGCHDWVCVTTLLFFALLAVAGTLNQLKMNKLLVAMEADEDFEGSNRYENLIVKLNEKFALFYAINDVVKEAGAMADLSQEELEKLAKKHEQLYLQIATIASDAALVVVSGSLITSVIETVFSGALQSAAVWGMALLITLVGGLSIALAVIAVLAHRVQDDDEREKAERKYLYYASVLMPAQLALCILVKLSLPDSVVRIQQLQYFFDIDTYDPGTKALLVEKMGATFTILSTLLLATAVSWSIVTKAMGGQLYLVSQASTFATKLLLGCGGCIALVAFLEGAFDTYAGNAQLWLYRTLGFIGIATVGMCALGIRGLRTYETSGDKSMLKVYYYLLLAFMAVNLVLAGVVVYFISVVDDSKHSLSEHVDQTWEAVKDEFSHEHPSATKEDFVELFKSGFQVVQLSGVVVMPVQGAALYGVRTLLRSGGKIEAMSTRLVAHADDATSGDALSGVPDVAGVVEHNRDADAQETANPLASGGGALSEGADGNAGAKKEATKAAKVAAKAAKKNKGKKDKAEGGDPNLLNRLNDSALKSLKEEKEVAQLKALWEKVDLDGSGALDEDEVRAVLDGMGKTLGDDEFKKAMVRRPPPSIQLPCFVRIPALLWSFVACLW